MRSPAGVASVLHQGQRGAERARVRPQGRAPMQAVLQTGQGRPSLAPGVYFRLLLVGYCEGIGSEAGHRLAGGRFAVAAGVPGFRTGRADAGPLDDLAHAPVVRAGNAQGGVPVVRPGAGRGRTAGRADGGHRRDDAGSQRGDALDPAAGRRAQVRGVSEGAGRRGRESRATVANNWRAWTASGRRRPATGNG